MIDDLDKTIAALLAKELRADNQAIDISFSAPNGDWVSKLGNAPTLNFFLYDIRENAPLRRHQWQQITGNATSDRPLPNGNGRSHQDTSPQAPARANTVQLKRTPLMMDCFYMVSAWSPADDRAKSMEEHNLLSLCMLALARYPILNPNRLSAQSARADTGRARLPARPARNELDDLEDHEAEPSETDAARVGASFVTNRPVAEKYLVGTLATQTLEIRTRLAHHDVMTNPAEVWSALENQMRAAFSYIVTLPLDPWAEDIYGAGEVGGVRFIGPGPLARTDKPKLPRGKPAQDIYQQPVIIGGVIFQTTGDGELEAREGKNYLRKEIHPLAGLNIWIVETGLRTTTNAEGRFTFRSLPPGTYTIAVYPPQEREPTHETDFILPADRTDKALWSDIIVIPADKHGSMRPITVELPQTASKTSTAEHSS